MSASRSIVPPRLNCKVVSLKFDGQQALHQGRDGGDQTGLWCGSDVMQGIHPTCDQTDMGRAAFVWQGFPSGKQGEGSVGRPMRPWKKWRSSKRRSAASSDPVTISHERFPTVPPEDGRSW
jgi:hypothetical protein